MEGACYLIYSSETAGENHTLNHITRVFTKTGKTNEKVKKTEMQFKHDLSITLKSRYKNLTVRYRSCINCTVHKVK